MSLTPQQEIDTKQQINANFKLAEVPIEQVAQDLDTTPEHVQDILDLNPTRLEEPWILKAYLDEKISEKGGTPVPYTALLDDPKHYWFLNNRFLKKGKLLS